MAEKKEIKQISIRLELEDHERLSALAKEEHRTLHNFVYCILRQYMEEHKA